MDGQMTAFCSFLDRSPSQYHAVGALEQMFAAAGYAKLSESDAWQCIPGGKYYLTRGGSAFVAFAVPAAAKGFAIAACHADRPGFKVKDNLSGCDAYTRLATEPYGGALLSTWLDRPLSIAGRVGVKTENGMEMRLVDFKDPCAVIPNVAIHLNKNANSMTYDPAVDMLPLWSCADGKGTFLRRAAECAGVKEEDILSTELFLYNPQQGCEWNDFISAPRLDDLQCAFAGIESFLAAKSSCSLGVFALFDHEEVGSATAQGAGSTFLADTLSRISHALSLSEEEYRAKLSSSFLLSCDNAHALHPNHAELSDKNHAPVPNGGVVIKHSTSRRYTTSAATAALTALLCDKAGVPHQDYRNRADLPGGSTLGAIALGQVSIPAADIGLAQLAMHSSFETAGKNDTACLKAMLQVFFEQGLCVKGESFTLV